MKYKYDNLTFSQWRSLKLYLLSSSDTWLVGFLYWILQETFKPQLVVIAAGKSDADFPLISEPGLNTTHYGLSCYCKS